MSMTKTRKSVYKRKWYERECKIDMRKIVRLIIAKFDIVKLIQKIIHQKIIKILESYHSK